MKFGFLLPCSAFVLLSFPACGDKTPAAPSPAPSPAANPTPAPTPAPAPQEKAPAKPKRVRVNYDAVKALLGSEPPSQAGENPSTPEKVALGKMLFHEPLAAEGGASCNTCHDLANYGQDGKPASPGGDRNAPSVWNASRQYAQFWDGRAKSAEEASSMHGVGDEAALLGKLKAKPEIVAAFDKAFPGGGDAVTRANFELAMGSFLRTLVTKSRFDAYLDGDQKALTDEEVLGLKLFFDHTCTQCHMSRLVGGNMFQKLGLLKPVASKDEGRARVTKNDAEKFFFKVPQLTNVEKTAPYYHDGSIKTLEEAVVHMLDVQLNKKLKPEEVAAIVAFLKALTGPLPEMK